MLDERHGFLAWTAANNLTIIHRLTTCNLECDPPRPKTAVPNPKQYADLLVDPPPPLHFLKASSYFVSLHACMPASNPCEPSDRHEAEMLVGPHSCMPACLMASARHHLQPRQVRLLSWVPNLQTKLELNPKQSTALVESRNLYLLSIGFHSASLARLQSQVMVHLPTRSPSLPYWLKFIMACSLCRAQSSQASCLAELAELAALTAQG